MPRKTLPAAQAARALGISLDTLRRWDRQGRIRTARDSANRRVVPVAEVERLRAAARSSSGLSARNRLRGTVREVRSEGVLAQVELEVVGPARVVAVITSEAARELGLEPGSEATALVKATSVMIER